LIERLKYITFSKYCLIGKPKLQGNMAEETKNSEQVPQGGGALTGDMSRLLVGVGNLIDNAIEPVSKVVALSLDSLTEVAKQILDGISATLGGKK
jgi:hypothetical protein